MDALARINAVINATDSEELQERADLSAGEVERSQRHRLAFSDLTCSCQLALLNMFQQTHPDETYHHMTATAAFGIHVLDINEDSDGMISRALGIPTALLREIKKSPDFNEQTGQQLVDLHAELKEFNEAQMLSTVFAELVDHRQDLRTNPEYYRNIIGLVKFSLQNFEKNLEPTV
ncbi:hypothetical protein [Oenococcus sicerae]|uniref:Uncharacterized protein n=1 Tax=Oenococcus sicerae TaxID=2203724 RepID=A0AAJ1RDB5_9LACO|nr:hypothetical protein [Oenococcus sicerae]MDN6900657.1 hypothetical protein [Oenococcus sicerae]